MSELPLATIVAENLSLKGQLEQAVNQANGFVAQLDAHKQMLSESITSCLNLRAMLVNSNRMIQEANGKVQAAEASVASLSQTITDLTANNAALEAKVAELSVQAQSG